MFGAPGVVSHHSAHGSTIMGQLHPVNMPRIIEDVESVIDDLKYLAEFVTSDDETIPDTDTWLVSAVQRLGTSPTDFYWSTFRLHMGTHECQSASIGHLLEWWRHRRVGL